MDLDVAAVRSIEDDLQRSAQAVNVSAQQIAKAGQGFDAAAAGTDYRSQGDRVSRALSEVAAHLYGWANCTHDLAGVLGKAVTTNVGVDHSTAASLNNLGETLT
ncbi:hypothetical protein [Nocardia vaccinii]|uniref:hypothetical protein n=1 Tax=Nocardia vaccinii TaxID=1822 RepID=UPI00082F1F37|nr:hypothetical protein [Nocardia vaccinii]